jgi:hypothetical protein
LKFLFQIEKYFFLFLLLCACQISSPGNENQTESQASDTLLSRYSYRMQAIFRKEKGILQGVDFNDSADLTLSLNDSALHPLEPEGNQISYLLTLNVYEDCELIFFHNAQNRITGFGIDPYLRNQASVDSLSAEMSDYFTRRFGKTQPADKRKKVWQTDSLHIVMTDVSIEKAPALQIRIMRK